MSTKRGKIPFVLKDDFVSVVIDKQSFSLNKTHPSFSKLRKAIKDKNWKLVPKLVSTAKLLSVESHGDVDVREGKVFYKGEEVHSSLAQRIVDMVSVGKPVRHLVRFMNLLEQNPSPLARKEFYDWLDNNHLPICDNGCFLAYKSIRDNYTDTHTGTVDNRPGQTILGSRKWFDGNYREQCSTGYHVCSKQYGTYGDRTMAVMINPRDVLSAVSGKMRVVNYEVLKELGKKGDLEFENFYKTGFSEIEKKLVIEVAKERGELIKLLLAHPNVKREIRKKKLSKLTIGKSSFARLKSMAQRYKLIPEIGPEQTNKLEAARKAAGLSIGQLARAMKIPYKQVALMEKKGDITTDQHDKYVEAIASLTKISNPSRSAVTFPRPTKVA